MWECFHPAICLTCVACTWKSINERRRIPMALFNYFLCWRGVFHRAEQGWGRKQQMLRLRQSFPALDLPQQSSWRKMSSLTAPAWMNNYPTLTQVRGSEAGGTSNPLNVKGSQMGSPASWHVIRRWHCGSPCHAKILLEMKKIFLMAKRSGKWNDSPQQLSTCSSSRRRGGDMGFISEEELEEGGGSDERRRIGWPCWANCSRDRKEARPWKCIIVTIMLNNLNDISVRESKPLV